MKLAIAHAVMAVAIRCLGDHRHEWALAMRAEFDAAAEAGEPLSFALGCLLGAWREMPAHEEGRFALASHVLAVGIIVPVAAILLSSVALGSPYLISNFGAGALLGSGRPTFPVTDANRAGLPLMAFLTIALGLGHLRLAWAMLDRNWTHVALLCRASAAVMATMLTFTCVMFLYDSCALPQLAVIATELAAVWTLVQWHAEMSADAPHKQALVHAD